VARRRLARAWEVDPNAHARQVADEVVRGSIATRQGRPPRATRHGMDSQ